MSKTPPYLRRVEILGRDPAQYIPSVEVLRTSEQRRVLDTERIATIYTDHVEVRKLSKSTV